MINLEKLDENTGVFMLNTILLTFLIFILVLLQGCSTAPKCNQKIVVTDVICPRIIYLPKPGGAEQFCRLVFSDGSDFYVGVSAGRSNILKLKGQEFCK